MTDYEQAIEDYLEEAKTTLVAGSGYPYHAPESGANSLHAASQALIDLAESARRIADALEAQRPVEFSAELVSEPVGKLLGFIALDCDGEIASVKPARMVEVGADVFRANGESARPGQPYRVVEVREVSA